MKDTFQGGCLLRTTFLIASIVAGDGVSAEPNNRPVMTWTAREAPDFQYQVLENVKVTELRHAMPEMATFNHHPYLAHFQNILFACWDTQLRDENTSGQHGLFCFSKDNGESWSVPLELSPPLADNVPASEAKENAPFYTSQGFAHIDGKLFAVTMVDFSLKDKVYRFTEVSRTRVGLLAREVRADATPVICQR